MISGIRKAFQTPVGKVALGIIFLFLIAAFAVWGINDIFRGRISNAVAVVAGKEMGPQEFRAEMDRELNRLREQTQRNVTMQEARDAGVDKAVLERLVGQRAIDALAASLGVVAAPTAVAAQIRGIEAFRNPVTGQFDQETYREVLASNGLTITQFEAGLTQELVRRKLLLAATTGVRAPEAMGAGVIAFVTERRPLRLTPIDPELIKEPGQPTDAELKAFYDSQRERLTIPESRAATLVIGRTADFQTRAQVEDAKVRELYEFRKASLGTPPTRSFVQIVAPSEAVARQAAERLAKGESPAAVASALKLNTPITYTDVDRARVPDAKIAEAVFAAAAPGPARALQGALSWSAVQITKATAGSTPPFESAAPALREELRKEQADADLAKAMDAFETAVGDGQTLEEAAKAQGLEIRKAGAIGADGSPRTGPADEILARDAELRAQLFQAGEGDLTQIVPLPEQAGYVVARLDTIVAAAPPALADIRAPLIGEWRRTEAIKALEARAQEVLADARKRGLDAAAKAIDRPVVARPQPLLRNVQGDPLISPQLAAEIFKAPAGGLIAGQAANGIWLVIEVGRGVRDAPAARPDRLQQARQVMTQELSDDFARTVERVARNRAKAEIFPDRALSALGLAAEEPAGGAPASGS